MHVKHFFFSLLIISSNITAQLNPLQYSQQKVINVNNAAVVSAHPLASEAGIMIIRKGGNAIDAAIATQLALAVVYPGAGNLGGGGFLLARFNTGKTLAIDYREMAPGRSYKDMFLDSAGDPIKSMSLEGHLASGVPGTVAGLFESMRYAKLDLKLLIAPAITLAEKGFKITASQASSFNSHRAAFLRANPGKKIAFVKATDWKAGDLLIQPELAATLKRIRDKGSKGFYEGITAHMIAAEMKTGNGIISLKDLAAYKAVQRKAMKFDYKGYDILAMPLPSSGGILLQQMLTMSAPYDLARKGFHSTESIQVMVEAERRAYADRAYYLGDQDHVAVPVSTLISKTYLMERMNDLVLGKAGNSGETKHGGISESEETTHISIIDKDGNAVSVTTTLNDSYGSKVVVKGAGFLLNNEMDDFSVKEGAANMYGAIGNAANAIAPGKRMLSSMCPVIVLKNNKPFMVVGTPGGTTIPTSVFQSIVNVIDFKLSAADAVNLPKFHHQWLPDIVYVEKTMNVAVTDSLASIGYNVQYRDPIGRTELILINKKNITAVADKRGDDSAAGF